MTDRKKKKLTRERIITGDHSWGNFKAEYPRVGRCAKEWCRGRRWLEIYLCCRLVRNSSYFRATRREVVRNTKGELPTFRNNSQIDLSHAITCGTSGRLTFVHRAQQLNGNSWVCDKRKVSLKNTTTREELAADARRPQQLTISLWH